MSEASEQAVVVEWCAWHSLPVFHIPNGGYRTAREAANFKRQGVKAGVPDLFIPIASSGKHGLFIEMKKQGGRVSEAQKKWLKLLAQQGYEALVCYGADEAIKAIESYLW